MKVTKRISLLLPAIALALTSCAPAAEVDRSGDFYLSLPRVEVQLTDNGAIASIAGFSPEAIRTLSFGLIDASQFGVQKEIVDWLKSTDTQHIELAFNGRGAYVFVNGKALPHIAFSSDSVNTVGDLAGTLTGALLPGFEVYGLLARRFLPLARSLGLNLVIRLPKMPGAPDIPLRDLAAKTAAKQDTKPSYAALARLVITYDENGVPSVADISAAEVQQLFGIDLSLLYLDPGWVKLMMDRGIQHFSLRSEKDGLTLAVNDKPLPNLMCDAECLLNTSKIIGRLNTYPELQDFNPIIEQFGPQLSQVSVELAVRFPLAPGAKRIPLPFESLVE